MNLLLHEINQLAELELELEHALTQELRTGAAAAPVRASPRLQKARVLQHGLDGLAPKENLAHAGNVQQEEYVTACLSFFGEGLGSNLTRGVLRAAWMPGRR